MESSDFVTKNIIEFNDVDRIFDEYYQFYLKNGRFPSPYSKEHQEKSLYFLFYKVVINVSNFSLTNNQLKKLAIIKSIKEKKQRYDKLLNKKKLIEGGNVKEIYAFLLNKYGVSNKDALSKAFEDFVENNLNDSRKKDLNRIDNLRRKANYLALEIRMFMEENDISPSSIYSKKCYIRSFDGNIMTMRCAYNFVREYVNYIDDDLLEKLNNCHRIKKKLVKQEINN